MSTTITIPSDVTRLEVEINGKHYTYQGGATVSVPDEVAALINDNLANRPTETRPVHGPLAAETKKGDRYGVPILTDERGNMYADIAGAAAGVAKAVLDEIYVTGHKAVIPQIEE